MQGVYGAWTQADTRLVAPLALPYRPYVLLTVLRALTILVHNTPLQSQARKAVRMFVT